MQKLQIQRILLLHCAFILYVVYFQPLPPSHFFVFLFLHNHTLTYASVHFKYILKNKLHNVKLIPKVIDRFDRIICIFTLRII